MIGHCLGMSRKFIHKVPRGDKLDVMNANCFEAGQ
jgi:hypothetical protein